MKKLLALLLALVMMASCTLALAAGSPTGNTDSGVSTGSGSGSGTVAPAPVEEVAEEVTTEDAEATVTMLEAAELALPEGVKAEDVIAFEVETEVKEKLALTVPGLTASKKVYIAVMGEDGEITFVELEKDYFEADGEALTLKLAEIAKAYKLPATLQIVIA